MLTRKQHELLTFIDAHLKSTGFSPSFEEMKDALALKSKSGIHRLISALEERGFLRRHHHRARALEVIRLPDDRLAQERVAQERVAQERVAQEPAAPDRGAGERAPVESPARAADAPHFSPNVIRGDFTGRLPGVRSANDAGAVQLPLYGRIAAGLPIEALRDQGAQIEVPVAMLGNGDHYALEVAGDSMVDAGILDGDTVIIRQGDTAESGQIVVAMIDEMEVTLKRLRRRGQSIALEPANPRHEIRIFPADRVRVQGRLVALLRKY
jgi:repressor LexA